VTRTALPRPRPYDRVYAWRGFDHDVVPDQAVTVCGVEFPAPYVHDVHHPHRIPCATCFEEPS
jgi:hypothetical protein